MVSKTMNDTLMSYMTLLETSYHDALEQYSWRECLWIVGIPSLVENQYVQSTVSNILVVTNLNLRS